MPQSRTPLGPRDVDRYQGHGVPMEDLVGRLTELAEDPDAPAMVLVTHHVEEIPPGFTHALLLREGTVVASGLLTETLTAANLSKTFGLPLVVQRSGGRYTARAA